MSRKQYTNPFIKSPQQLELEDSVRVFKIWFHMLEYGDPVVERSGSEREISTSNAVGKK